MTRMDFRGERVKMKVWANGANEPVAWDIDIAKEDDDDTTPQDISYFAAPHVWGNTGMTFTFDTAWASGGGSTSGTTTDDLPRGDGVTTTWTVQPWTGTLIAYVDGFRTQLASFDRDAGTFTFDRAPALGAWITVEYAPA